jgi:hypothetical protein
MKRILIVIACCSLLQGQLKPESEIEYWRSRALQAEALVNAYRLALDVEQKRKELIEQCGRDKQLTEDPKSGRPICMGLPQPKKENQ